MLWVCIWANLGCCIRNEINVCELHLRLEIAPIATKKDTKRPCQKVAKRMPFTDKNFGTGRNALRSSLTVTQNIARQ